MQLAYTRKHAAVQVSALQQALDELRQARSGFRGFRLPLDIASGLRGLEQRLGLSKAGTSPNLDLESAGKKDLRGASGGRNGSRCCLCPAGNADCNPL